MSLFHKEFDEVPIEIFSALQKAWEADRSLVAGVGLMLTYDLQSDEEAYLWLMGKEAE